MIRNEKGLAMVRGLFYDVENRLDYFSLVSL
ncbi:hypothetical protein BOMU111920_23725 [Bordetella muralis]|jgi:hypothetical protein